MMENHMDEGHKNDADKVRLELFPATAIYAISQVITKGAVKYAERNWEKGMKWSRIYGAALRHLFAWFAGRGPTGTNFLFGDLDEEWGYSHLWHAGCCIVFLICYEDWKIGEDDRPVAARPERPGGFGMIPIPKTPPPPPQTPSAVNRRF